MTSQVSGNASPAMNEISPGTTTNGIHVTAKARASMFVDSESVSNGTDESELQYAKQPERRI
jgi:hypothetical protein